MRLDRTLEAYRALETLLADGKLRAIGVSNFTQAWPPIGGINQEQARGKASHVRGVLAT